jgi:putative ABC transport system substrate-binding protein
LWFDFRVQRARHWLGGKRVKVKRRSPASSKLSATGHGRSPRLRGHRSAISDVGVNATTIGEIDAAFATLARERPDALFVAGDAFFVSRAVQFTTLTARDRIPTSYSLRDYVKAGGLTSYGTDLADVSRQIGVYTGRILKGAKPADLPVVQSTKFEFVINMQTARALGVEVPAQLLATVDEVIE